MLIAMLVASGMLRMCRIAGTTRAISSLAPTGVEPGRVLSPPMSIIVAPEAMNCWTVFVR